MLKREVGKEGKREQNRQRKKKRWAQTKKRKRSRRQKLKKAKGRKTIVENTKISLPPAKYPPIIVALNIM